MGTYIDLLRQPGVARVMGSQLLARSAYGMVSLGFIMFFVEKYNSYAIAGLALGAQTIGVGVSSPWLARRFGDWGVRQTLLGCSLATSSLFLILVLLAMEPWVAVALSLCVGLTSPPIQSAVRLTFDALVEAPKIPALFSFDAITQEIIWVVGPILATFLAATVSTAAPMYLMASVMLIGSLWFLSNPEVRVLKVEQSQRRMGGVLLNSSILWIVAIGTVLIGAFSGIEVGTVAALDRATAGVVLAAVSVGSIVGGIWLGHRVRTGRHLIGLTAMILVGYLVGMLFTNNVTVLIICMLLAGLGWAPSLSLLNQMIAKAVPSGEAVEAYGWLGTGQLIGYSAGAAVSGVSVDHIGPIGAFAVAAFLGFATVLTTLLSRNSLPQLEKVESEKS